MFPAKRYHIVLDFTRVFNNALGTNEIAQTTKDVCVTLAVPLTTPGKVAKGANQTHEASIDDRFLDAGLHAAGTLYRAKNMISEASYTSAGLEKISSTIGSKAISYVSEKTNHYIKESFSNDEEPSNNTLVSAQNVQTVQAPKVPQTEDRNTHVAGLSRPEYTG